MCHAAFSRNCKRYRAKRAAFPVSGAERPQITIGSKSFTESVILGELVALLVGDTGTAVHRRALGGTRILWQALVRGDIDAYVEYTGTLAQPRPGYLPGRYR